MSAPVPPLAMQSQVSLKPLEIPNWTKIAEDLKAQELQRTTSTLTDTSQTSSSDLNTKDSTPIKGKRKRTSPMEALFNWLRGVFLNCLASCAKSHKKSKGISKLQSLNDEKRQEGITAAGKKAIEANSITTFIAILKHEHVTEGIVIDAICFLDTIVFNLVVEEMAKILEKEKQGMGLLAEEYIKMHADPHNEGYSKIIAAAEAAKKAFQKR